MQESPVLSWLRTKRQADDVHRVALRPFLLLLSRQPQVSSGLWQAPYCCTIAYFWTAVVTEDLCGGDTANESKFRTLREAFARLVEETDGTAHDALKRVLPDGHPIRRRALIDLKRVVDLYNGHIEDRHMIYPEYREAVYQDGRPAPEGNRWGLDKEFAYEILLSGYLAANAHVHEDENLLP
jgi:hypothetical protein